MGRIVLLISNKEILDWNLRHLPYDIIKRFSNLKMEHIYWTYWDFEKEKYCVVLKHKDFEKVEKGAIVPVLTFEEAKEKYPFLFEEAST